MDHRAIVYSGKAVRMSARLLSISCEKNEWGLNVTNWAKDDSFQTLTYTSSHIIVLYYFCPRVGVILQIEIRSASFDEIIIYQWHTQYCLMRRTGLYKIARECHVVTHLVIRMNIVETKVTIPCATLVTEKNIWQIRQFSQFYFT